MKVNKWLIFAQVQNKWIPALPSHYRVAGTQQSDRRARTQCHATGLVPTTSLDGKNTRRFFLYGNLWT